MLLQTDNLGKVAITVEKDYWDINKDYDKLTVVEKEGIFGTFISRKPVPAGTELTDRNYWIPFSSVKEEIVIDYNNFKNEYGTTLNDHTESLENIVSRLNILEENKDLINELIEASNTVIEDANTAIENANTALNNVERYENRLSIVERDSKISENNITNNRSKISTLESRTQGLQTIVNNHSNKINDIEQGNRHITNVPYLVDNLIPSQYLPSYVDDVLEFDNIESFPTSGESGKIYVDKSTNKTYRFSGTQYTEIAASLALGETSSTAYSGDKGKRNRDDINTLLENTNTLNSNINSIQNSISTLEEQSTQNDNSIAIINNQIMEINERVNDHYVVVDMNIHDISLILNQVKTRLDIIELNTPQQTKCSFAILQDGLNKDPDQIISPLYIIVDGEAIDIYRLNINYKNKSKVNLMAYLKEHTHAYVAKNYIDVDGVQKLKLKQLDDNDRTKFADGTSSLDYISNESGEYDVFIKFDQDIYYKVELGKPPIGSPDELKPIVTFAINLQEDEDLSKWEKWSQYDLIGVYEACHINNKLYSLSGKKARSYLTQENFVNFAKARGANFNISNYNMTKLLTLLFYGYYSTTNSQETCGYGTKTFGSNRYYSKLTGITDYLGMRDTNKITGTGAENPDSSQLVAGIGPDIKSVNFWGIENCWGDCGEWLWDLKTMKAFNSTNNAQKDKNLYIKDYIDEEGDITITDKNGLDTTYNSSSSFIADYSTNDDYFVSIIDKTNKIIRAIHVKDVTDNSSNIVKKNILINHGDIIAKEFSTDTISDVYFTHTQQILANPGRVAFRSGYSNYNKQGIGYLKIWFSPTNNYEYVGARLMYYGDESTVRVIDDATETL